MKYKVTQKLIDALKKEVFDTEGPKVTKTEYHVPHTDALVGIGKDWTLHLVIDDEALAVSPDYFEPVEESDPTV